MILIKNCIKLAFQKFKIFLYLCLTKKIFSDNISNIKNIKEDEIMENIDKKSDGELLKKFVFELATKLQNNKIHIDELQGKATIQGITEGKIFSFTIEQRDFTDDSAKNIDNKFVRKSDRKKEIKQLYQSGLKQTEIARKLNMSQSLVSKILNDGD